MDLFFIAFVCVYILTPIIVISGFVYFIKKRNIFLEIEKNQKALFTENCGGRFDGMGFTIPFVRFTIYSEFIIISYIRKIVLNFNEIHKIEFSKRLGTTGIHIYHKKLNTPKIIVIWSRHGDKIKDILNSKQGLFVSNK